MRLAKRFSQEKTVGSKTSNKEFKSMYKMETTSSSRARIPWLDGRKEHNGNGIQDVGGNSSEDHASLDSTPDSNGIEGRRSSDADNEDFFRALRVRQIEDESEDDKTRDDGEGGSDAQ